MDRQCEDATKSKDRRPRGYGDGCIEVKQTKNGRTRYMARIRLPGARRRTVGTFSTEREAIRALQRAQGEARAGRVTTRSRTTVEGYLDWWLGVKENEGKAYMTMVSYRAAVKRAVQAFGKLRLDALEPSDIRQLIADTNRTSGLRTAQQTRTILHGAFEYAVDEELLGRNPASRIKPPRKSKDELADAEPVLDIGEAFRLFEGTEGQWCHAVYVVAATTGLRQGELLGLSWRDVNLTDSKVERCGRCGRNKPLRPLSLHVHQQQQRRTGAGFVLTDVKTVRSRREVPLPDIAIEAMRAQRDRIKAQRRKLGLEWAETGRVFPSIFGTPMDAANLRDRFYADLGRLGLPRVTLHSLRKTAASVMAAYGVPVALTQALMGHEKSSTTLDIYTRVGSTELDIARNSLNAVYSDLRRKSTLSQSGHC
jgi:integrase